jgi:hypothetical protein
MLAGFGGHLLSESFLETHLATAGSADDRTRQRLAEQRRQCESLGPASSLRTLLDMAAAPLVELAGFEPPRDVEALDSVLVATIRCSTQHVLLLVAPWGERLEPFWRLAVTSALRRGASWCAMFNGASLRIVDPARPYSRRFLEFDLDLAADDERAFRAFWFVMERFPTSLRALVEASERHATAVRRSLRDGVLAASCEVLGALVRPTPAPMNVPLADPFEQALTIVYRIVFLLFAEARGLVPLWHPVYRDSYSIDALRSTAERTRCAAGFWEALRAIARLAHAGCRAGDLRVTPFNGRLFAPARTPLAERRNLDDEAARRALLALSTRAASDRGGRERIAYRDLGVEQLGAVYETLLDYEPRLQRESQTYRIALHPGSGVRKATGTFYTPQPIADYLIRRTLAPLVRKATPARILQLRILDPAMGSGAFLVAACRYLAEAYEAALVKNGGCHPSDITERERAIIRRAIAERCLYGVDVNPMAVQLARLSLWLATLAADRPLTFLDHHLQVGDSLLGAWLTALTRPPGRPRRMRHQALNVMQLFDEAAVRDALRGTLPVRFSLESMPNETLEHVRAKERALAQLNRRDAALARWKRVADLWCACWVPATSGAVPGSAFGALADAIVSGRGALSEAFTERYLRMAEEVARARRFFHWELEFPEAFFDPDGARLPTPGFDAVVGNPPWDMIRADAGSADARTRSRRDIDQFLRFTRDAGVYTAQSGGHANRYQLFAERAMALARPGGRIGLVLPSGLATDHGSAALRRHFLTGCDVDALVGFDNQHGVFPIHRSVRFLLVTATTGSPTGSIACRLGERDPASLDTTGDEPPATSPWFPVRLTPALIHRLSGDALAIPNLRTPTDVAIAERAATMFPPLGSDGGWSARFGRELNATDDRAHFGRPGAGVPVVEGKHLEPFRVDVGATRHSITAANARRLLNHVRHQQPRLAYRDVASATNRLTLIAAILPAGCVSTHTVFCLRTPLPPVSQHFLCGLFNSFVVNYLVRLRVTTHVTTATVERLPFPRRDDSPRAFRRIAALARLLARRSDPVASARLQAHVAELYQLSAAEFSHVLDTFPLISKEERDRALETYLAL